jgi:ceramide kinase
MKLFVNGAAADVSLDSDALRWSPSFEDDAGGSLLGGGESTITANTFSNGQGLFFCFPTLEASAVNIVPIKEMLCAERLIEHRNSDFFNFSNFLPSAMSSSNITTTITTDAAKPLLYGFCIHTFKRSASKPSEWHPFQLSIESKNEELIETLLSEISSCISAISASRPRHVLLILNPNAGSGAAHAHYRNILHPLLSKAGISAKVVVTERAGHAKQIVVDALSLSLPNSFAADDNTRNNNTQELEYDGIVAVGGDGIFHEILNGLLEAQSRQATIKLPGHRSQSLLSSLRLAHIPCGSTDAVACSLHGSRSVFTAAMHMALGDSTPLDALKVSVGGTVRYACCIATYGFMGDVVQDSEKHRWLGPLRYDIIGAMKILHNQSYACRVSYIPAQKNSLAVEEAIAGRSKEEEEEEKEDITSVCVQNCSICRAASIASSASHRELSDANTINDNDDDDGKFNDEPEEIVKDNSSWCVVEGEWMSIMLIVHPCRSDKTPHGMSRYGHLNDGRFTLVLVRRCSPFNYLKFLATMSSSGVAPGMMPGVLEVIDAVACKVESMGSTSSSSTGESDGNVSRTSHWNIDGEIVQGADGTDGMEAHAQLGAVQCFARGVEI